MAREKDFFIKEEEVVKPVVNHMTINIRSVDRTSKDVGNWWTELQNAESVYYPNRSGLYDVLSTVELDGTLSGLIDKRIKSVTNKPLYFKKDGKKIDELDQLTKKEAFKSLRKHRFQFNTHGLYGLEIIPGKEFSFNKIPIKHINVERKLITKEQWGNDGFSYDGMWNIIVKGVPGYFGLLNKCAPYALWKKGDMGDWARYVEVFGDPFIIFTYDANDVKTKTELDEIMRNIGSGNRIQLPKQAGLDVKDGKQSNGDGALQDKLRLACNQEMSIIVLGVTETTTSSSSSGYAQSKVHAQQQDEIRKDDMDDELAFFNSPQWLAIQKSYGLPYDGEWCYEEEIDLDKVQKQVNIIKIVRTMQPVDDDYVYKTTGIPKPDNYIQEKSKMEKRQDAVIASGKKPADPKNDKEKKTGNKKPASLSAWEKFRSTLADFFAPAPKD